MCPTLIIARQYKGFCTNCCSVEIIAPHLAPQGRPERSGCLTSAHVMDNPPGIFPKRRRSASSAFAAPSGSRLLPRHGPSGRTLCQRRYKADMNQKCPGFNVAPKSYRRRRHAGHELRTTQAACPAHWRHRLRGRIACGDRLRTAHRSRDESRGRDSPADRDAHHRRDRRRPHPHRRSTSHRRRRSTSRPRRRSCRPRKCARRCTAFAKRDRRAVTPAPSAPSRRPRRPPLRRRCRRASAWCVPTRRRSAPPFAIRVKRSGQPDRRRRRRSWSAPTATSRT